MNKRIQNMYCIGCGQEYTPNDYFQGCPKCLAKGTNSSVTFKYHGKAKTSRKFGMLKFSDRLPYKSFPTLGEGGTPVISLEKLAKKLNLASLYSKNEFQNPTGSHKDRMNPLIVARAIELGKEVVAAASSGNEGVSLAAYAALAGLECNIISTANIQPGWKSAIVSTGANLIIKETSEERWEYLAKMVETEGWYPATNYITPPVGSNCFGLQGYKTIAFELVEFFGNNLPEYMLIPVARGDLLYGIYEGFCEMKQEGIITCMPKLVAIEPLPRLEKILDKEADYRDLFPGQYELTESIGGNTATLQSKIALENSGGMAVSIRQDEVVSTVLDFAKHGLYLESSSAIVVGGLKKLCNQKRIPSGSSVILVATSGGSKNGPDIVDAIIRVTASL
nr:pyridoxal-phosphate dependent enzyme [Clostridioides sp.]